MIDWLNIVLRPIAAHYSHAEIDDANDDEIVRNPVLHFKDTGFFYIQHHIDMVKDGHAFDLQVCPHWGGKAGSVYTNMTLCDPIRQHLKNTKQVIKYL